jgi:uncharacterized membrane protein
MKLLRILTNNWRLLLSALTAAAIIHIWTTLATVHRGEATGYRQLASKLAVNRISYLPEVTPQNQRIAFMMPDNRYAICRFDATAAPMIVRAALPGPGWSLSVHAPNGDNVLFVPGTNDRVTNISIVIKPSGQLFEAKTIGSLPTAGKTPEISLTQDEGLVIYRAPVPALAKRRLVDEQLNSFQCFPQQRRRS